MPREEFPSFERIFGLKETGSIFNYKEWSIAELVYCVACDEIRTDKNECNNGYDDDNDSVQSFDEQIEAVMDSLKRIVELYKKSSKAKDVFLAKFSDRSSCRMNNIESLKEIAEEIQTYKLKSDITQVAGNALAAVGGVMTFVSFFTPLVAVTAPLAIAGIGCCVVKGARTSESFHLKSKVEEAKTLVMKDKFNFSTIVDLWFNHTKELKVAIESLVSYNLLKEMSRDLQGFHEMNSANRSKQVLKLCIGKMLKFSNIIESFGFVYAPVVMTFVIVICLLRHHNWIVLDCTMQTCAMQADHLKKSRRSINLFEEVIKNCLATELGVVAGIVINVLDMVLTSIDIYNRPEVEDAKKIKEAAELLEDELLFVESVYDELWKKEPIIFDCA